MVTDGETLPSHHQPLDTELCSSARRSPIGQSYIWTNGQRRPDSDNYSPSCQITLRT